MAGPFFKGRHQGKESGKVMKRVWTRSGWVLRKTTAEEREIIEGAKTRNATGIDFDFNSPPSEMGLVQEVQNQIQYDCTIGPYIDQLPGGLRQVVQSPYEWLIKNTRLFKILHPINQVKEKGIWGSDSDEQDDDVLAEQPSVSRLYLEQLEILPSDAPTEEVIDVLGQVTDSIDLPNTGAMERADTDISRISIIPEIVHQREDSDYDEDNQPTAATQRLLCAALPEIRDEVKAKVMEIHAEYKQLLVRATDDREKELLKLKYEQALDRAVSADLTLRLNSPFCARGYTLPRRSYVFINTPRQSAMSNAKEEREHFFYEVFAEAAACTSMDDLFGSLVTVYETDALGHAVPRRRRSGGFMGKIRGMYHADKALAITWSINDKVDKDGKILERSALNKAREQFIREWREESRGDEEALRVAVWAWFDRKSAEYPPVYDENSGELVEPGRRYRDSIWRQQRSRALTELFLTRPQWDAVYSMCNIARDKLKITGKPEGERKETLEILAEYFRKIQCLQDLRAYVRWAMKRHIYPAEENGRKTLKVKPCKLDLLSEMDEILWHRSVTKKKKFLIQRIQLFRQLADIVVKRAPMEMGDIAIACPYPAPKSSRRPTEPLESHRDLQCDCMAIGVPEFCEIEGKEGKGLLAVECDNCKRLVWLLDYKEQPTLKTKEEWEDAHKNTGKPA